MRTDDDSKKPILVPVDFASHSQAALLCAIDLAADLDVDIVVLHVVHDPGDAPGYYRVEDREGHLRSMKDVAAEMLDSFLEEFRSAHKQHRSIDRITSMLVVGLPVGRILESAAKVGARMIVMGSQGRTGLAHTMLGSKAEQVVRLAPMPVMIVKAEKS